MVYATTTANSRCLGTRGRGPAFTLAHAGRQRRLSPRASHRRQGEQAPELKTYQPTRLWGDHGRPREDLMAVVGEKRMAIDIFRRTSAKLLVV
jgi:hypothetical protein